MAWTVDHMTLEDFYYRLAAKDDLEHQTFKHAVSTPNHTHSALKSFRLPHFFVMFFLAEMHMSVRQVSIPSEPDSSYFLRLDWAGRDLGGGFQLLLTDGQNAWRGEGERSS